jgi:hypothetical protein
VKDTSIVRWYIVCVEVKAFLYYYSCQQSVQGYSGSLLHLLKLVTGVDISTRPVRIFGRDGNAVKRSSRTAAAAPKSSKVSLPMVRL